MTNTSDNLHNMMCLDIYLMSLNDDIYQRSKPKLKASKHNCNPLMSWDLNDVSTSPLSKSSQKSFDRNFLQSVHGLYNWNIDIEKLLGDDYQALVLTDIKQNIMWVNYGFTEMTGYTHSLAVGKKPTFLQGENTSLESKAQIKQKLTQHKPYSGQIINYRKSKEQYLCEVKIIPISNRQNQFIHFLAVEKEISEF